MKILIFLLFLSANCFGQTTYYFSTAGAAGNAGTSQGASWPFSKINSATYNSGDILLLKSGDTCAIPLAPTRGLISFASYGTGAKPVISGLTNVTGWTANGSGVYSTVLSSAPTMFDVKIVTINGRLQGMGQTPNAGQWWNYQDTGWINSTTRTIIDSQHTSVNYTGAQAVIRMNSYVTDIATITNQSGGTITYTIPKSFDLTNDYTLPYKNYGYFIQNALSTLDQFGEWFWNKNTKTLSVFFGANNPNSYVVNTSFVTDMIYLGDGGFGTSGTTAYSDITVDGLDIQGGTRNGVYGFNALRTKVQNCNFSYNGNGVFLWASSHCLINNNTVNYSLNNGIVSLGQGVPYGDVTNNSVHYSGMLDGLANSGYSTSLGISQSGDNYNVLNNTVDSSGYTGIYFNGGNILVAHNWVKYFCAKKDDGGGIYTFYGRTDPNRIVEYNIVEHGIGARAGRPENAAMTHALYSDGETRNVIWRYNTANDIDGAGMLANNPVNVNFLNNTAFNCADGIDLIRWAGGSYLLTDTITNNIIHANTTLLTFLEQTLTTPTSSLTFAQDVAQIGVINNNKYRSGLPFPMNIYYYKNPIDTSYNYQDVARGNGGLGLSQWQGFSGKDAASSFINATGTPTLFTNPTLSSTTLNFGVNTYVDSYGSPYLGTTSLAPGRSLLLFYTGTTSTRNYFLRRRRH